MLKTERLTIKVSPPEKVGIQRIAEYEGEPVAVVVRRLIRQAVASHESTKPIAGQSGERNGNVATVANRTT